MLRDQHAAWQQRPKRLLLPCSTNHGTTYQATMIRFLAILFSILLGANMLANSSLPGQFQESLLNRQPTRCLP
jgi:hypothetical protein